MSGNTPASRRRTAITIGTIAAAAVMAVGGLELPALAATTSGATPAAKTSCQVDVRANPIAIISNHLFIIYMTNGKNPYYYRGGPSINRPPRAGQAPAARTAASSR